MDDPHQCPVCGSTDKDHMPDNEHGFYPVHKEGEPVALVLPMQGMYDRAHSKARALAFARAQMKQHYPGKDFEIIPTRFMVTKENENGVLHGEAHVATYIAYEK